MLGITYEKRNIEKWMKMNLKSPITHVTLTSKSLVTNFNLKRQIYGHFPTEESRRYHQANFFAYVPPEILLSILLQLDIQSLCRMCQVCAYFQKVEEMYLEKLWEAACYHLNITQKSPKSTWKQIAQEVWKRNHESKKLQRETAPGLLLTRA
jgi:hypothetical protein